MFTILHIIPTFEGGGAERQLSMLACEQAKRGWSVHVGVRRGGVHEETVRGNGVVVHKLGDYRGLNPMLGMSINTLIREIKPDLIQTWLMQMDIMGGAVVFRNAIPWVISERVSELGFQDFGLLAWLRFRFGRHANAVVANSVAGAKYWDDILPTGTCVSTVSNAVDVEKICGAFPVKIEQVDTSKDLILVVGRLAHQKAIEIIIQAVALMSDRNDFQVVIMGDGPLRPELEATLEDSGAADHIVMLPYQKDWWGLLKVASVLVSMSRFEGQPNVVLETMAAGCPLIVSDIPEHREILSKDSAIFVETDNSVALAKAIDLLLGDPVSARQRAALASKFVDHLTIEIAADAYESVYEKIMGRSVKQCAAL